MRQTERTPDVGRVEGSGDLSSLAANSTRDNQARIEKQVATLTPRWRGGNSGYCYDATFNGEQVVTDSTDPEHDLARALLAKGVTGVIEIVEAESGKARTFVNVVPAAKWSIFEGQRQLGRGRWKPFEAIAVALHSPEDGQGGSGA